MTCACVDLYDDCTSIFYIIIYLLQNYTNYVKIVLLQNLMVSLLNWNDVQVFSIRDKSN